MNDMWLKVVGFNEYEVSDRGRVRSVDRIVVTSNGQRRKYRGQLLSPATDDKGYQRVGLWRGNKQTGALVHRLVIEAFMREMESDEEGNHLDFNKKNNTLHNLEISTPTANTDHATNAGRMAKKLTEEQVLKIKHCLALGENSQNIAERFAVSRPAVNAIAWGKTWKRIPCPGVSR